MDDGDQPQGDFDGSGNASWGEADWAGYLHRNDLEVGRFLSYYAEVKNLPDRLDVSARRMGWENADWAPGDSPDEADDADEEAADLPYCIHQHPVYVVARALSLQLVHCFRRLCADAGPQVPALVAADVMRAFWDAEHQMVMAINATDTGDLPLALVHMKRALGAINYAIGLSAGLPAAARLSSAEAAQDIESTLFDLREVCLRVMADCRWDGNKR
ncbi:MAG: hypothetical protein RLZZ322_1337 [Verrucomicrobiota bacterium]|jgi:hypothetical protein